MKIAVNTRLLLKDYMEGVGRFTFEILKRMVESHPEHEFYFIFDRQWDESFVFAPNITPLKVFPPARHPLLWAIWYEAMLPRVLAKIKPDVFISPDNHLSLRTKIPTIYVQHDLAYLHCSDGVSKSALAFYRHFTPKYLKRADQIVAVSEYTKKDIIHQFSIDSDKISVVYNACDEKFQPVSEDEKSQVRELYTDGEEYFLYVGSIHPRKNVARLIEAFGEFKKETGASHKLVLLGRMAWKTSQEQKVLASSPYKDDIVLLGYKPSTEIARIVASAFALTYVSIFEGFGIPILEAFYCDTPVITSNVSSMPEVAGDAAVLVDPFSIESIANGMVFLLKNPKERHAMIERAKSQRKKFSWENSAKQMWGLVEGEMK